MKKSITVGAILCISGSSLDSSTIQSYVPQTHKYPSADVVANYIHGKWYSPQRSQKDWDRSEARKSEILARIGSIRSEIRKKADTMQRANAAHKMLETIACTMENRTMNRDRELRHQRAQELHIPAKYISADILRQRKGMPVVDMNEIV